MQKRSDCNACFRKQFCYSSKLTNEYLYSWKIINKRVSLSMFFFCFPGQNRNTSLLYQCLFIHFERKKRTIFFFNWLECMRKLFRTNAKRGSKETLKKRKGAAKNEHSWNKAQRAKQYTSLATTAFIRCFLRWLKISSDIEIYARFAN